MKKEEKRLIHKLFITEEQLKEAITKLYDDFGPSLSLMSQKQIDTMVSNYWEDRKDLYNEF